MSWIKLNTTYHNHRKTRALRRKIGFAANWVMPQIWCYAAANQPDGDLSDYTYEEIRKMADYEGDAEKFVLHLQTVGYIDSDMKLHDWMEHNGYSLAAFKLRAERGAKAKWDKVRAAKENPPSSTIREDNEEYVDNVVSIAPSTASSTASSRKKKA